MRRDGDLAPQEQLAPGVDPETWDGRRGANLLHSHLLAIAFGDTFTGLLDDNRVGSHHGIAPHVTVTVDLARFEAGMGADLTMPGSDNPVVLPNETVRRILCDADVTTVVVRPLAVPNPDGCTTSLAGLLLEGPARSSTSGARSASSRLGSAARSRCVTGTAVSPAAEPTSAVATPTTSPSGRTAARRTSTTQSCCACVITTPCTRAAGRSPVRRHSGRRHRVLGLHPTRTTKAALVTGAHHPPTVPQRDSDATSAARSLR
jgi:hypothetical protein